MRLLLRTLSPRHTEQAPQWFRKTGRRGAQLADGLRKLFQLAKVVRGHAHRFRDTFAVELLRAGVPIERVSILLGHQSTRVTEKQYNPWVRSRQEQLEADLERAWSRDPLVLLDAKVTRRLRGEPEAVN